MPKTRAKIQKENDSSLSNSKPNISLEDKKSKYSKRKWDDYIQENKEDEFNIDLKKIKNDNNINIKEKILEKLNIKEDSISNKVNNIYIFSNIKLTDNTKISNNKRENKNDVKLIIK